MGQDTRRSDGRSAARVAARVAALVLLSCSPLAAQFAAFDWTFDSATCGSGVLTDESMFVKGPDGAGCTSNQFVGFETTAPYAGTVFVRFDFVNHDVFYFVDCPAYVVDGVVSVIGHIGPSDGEAFHSMTFDVPAGSTFGLGAHSVDSIFGAGDVDYFDFRFFPRGATTVATSPSADEGFGASVAGMGDVDGDGVPDAVVGAPFSDVGALDAGRVAIVSGADGSQLLSVAGAAAGDMLGHDVDGAGDVDGDGVPDLVAGAPFSDASALDGGRAVVLSGADGSLLHALAGGAPNDQLGRAVAGVGDVDGDGVPDVLVGAPLDDQAGNKAGKALLVSGADGSVLQVSTGASARDEFGSSLDGAGDVNADGALDLIVGSPASFVHVLGLGTGRIDVISGLDGRRLITKVGETPGEHFGATVAGAGDVDLDGFDDVIVGTPESLWGDVDVFSGADGSLLHAFDGLTFVTDSKSAKLGVAVAGVGDVDADGAADVAFTGRLFWDGVDDGYQDYRVAFVVSGRDGRLIDCLSGSVEVDPSFASALDGVGDVDGDGLDDVLVGRAGLSHEPDEAGTVSFVSSPVVWADLGHALPGAGDPATLVGVGTLAANTSLAFELDGAPAAAATFLVLGLVAVDAPFKGGVLVPDPALLLGPLPTAADGSLAVPTVWPAGIPSGVPIFVQAWSQDAAAPAGFSATNGRRGLSH